MGSKSSQRQFLVSVSSPTGGSLGRFSTKSGGRITADVSRVFDGGSLHPELMSGPAQGENITVSRPYDRDRDQLLWTDLRQLVGIYEATITVQPTDRNLVAKGDPIVYSEALLVAVGDPDYNAGSSDPAVLELEFAVSNYK